MYPHVDGEFPSVSAALRFDYLALSAKNSPVSLSCAQKPVAPKCRANWVYQHPVTSLCLLDAPKRRPLPAMSRLSARSMTNGCNGAAETVVNTTSEAGGGPKLPPDDMI